MHGLFTVKVKSSFLYPRHEMEELSIKYILLRDRVGHTVEKNFLSLGLTTKSTPMQVLRGELLKGVPEAEQPTDSTKVAVVGIERESVRLECSAEYVARLSEEDTNLLLAISSSEGRFQTYIDRKRLAFGRQLSHGRAVFVEVKGASQILPGFVWYKGVLPPSLGTWFGVELIRHPGSGTCDGTFRGKQYFICEPDSGVFVGLDKLTAREDEGDSKSSKITKKDEHIQAKLKSSLKDSILSFWKGKQMQSSFQGIDGVLKIDDRVVTFIMDSPARGTVRYIGEEVDSIGNVSIILGLELDERVGAGRGKRFGSQKFVCKRDYAAFVPFKTVIPEKAFDGNPGKAARQEGQDRRLTEKEEQEGNDHRLVRELKEQVTNLQAELREKELRETSLHEQLRKKEQLEENLRKQLAEMEQQLTNLRGKIQERNEQLRGVTQQMMTVQGQLQEKKEETSNLQNQAAALRQQLEEKDQEMNELETTLSTAQGELREYQRQQSPEWVISRDHIQLTSKFLGRGGWGSVVEGKYCGCSVAVKQIHELILSPYNRELFEREMDIASRCRHPCLLQFIGATNDEGNPLFVTEVMETSLRTLLEQRALSEAELSFISLDVARALNYLHQKQPSPIIHRDISSANVLLWRQGEHWRGKVSDYGTAKFVQQTMTVAPGAMIYSAPEALTKNQTVKVDVYSFGVLLCEMCIRELPNPERRDRQVAMVKSKLNRALIRGCLQSEPEARPSMREIIDELEEPV